MEAGRTAKLQKENGKIHMQMKKKAIDVAAIQRSSLSLSFNRFYRKGNIVMFLHVSPTARDTRWSAFESCFFGSRFRLRVFQINNLLVEENFWFISGSFSSDSDASGYKWIDAKAKTVTIAEVDVGIWDDGKGVPLCRRNNSGVMAGSFA